MAQNLSGTADTISPYKGGNIVPTGGADNDPPGVPDTNFGDATIPTDTTVMSQTHIEYRNSTGFATNVYRLGNA